MIRNIITAAILLAALVSMASVAQIANAVEPELNLDFSVLENGSANNLHYTYSHPYSWTPDISQQEKIIKLYEPLVLPSSINSAGFSGSDNGNSAEQRLFTFEVYQGDGLDDLRQQSKYHNNITLPDEDTEAYGVTVKQRF
ncbi:MAG: hypothetical protein ACRBDX_00640 [Gammaproteobacteria bacterium]